MFSIMDNFGVPLPLQFSSPRRTHLCYGDPLEPVPNLLSNLPASHFPVPVLLHVALVEQVQAVHASGFLHGLLLSLAGILHPLP